jgi:hypothetical protein
LLQLEIEDHWSATDVITGWGKGLTKYTSNPSQKKDPGKLQTIPE